MGLRFLIQSPNKEECYIVIDVKSIEDIIMKRITYPSSEATAEKMGDKDYILIHFWRGDKPV